MFLELVHDDCLELQRIRHDTITHQINDIKTTIGRGRLPGEPL